MYFHIYPSDPLWSITPDVAIAVSSGLVESNRIRKTALRGLSETEEYIDVKGTKVPNEKYLSTKEITEMLSELKHFQGFSSLPDIINKLENSKKDNKFRNPNGVALKFANILHIDPDHTGKGMKGASKLDRAFFEEYFNKTTDIKKKCNLEDHQAGFILEQKEQKVENKMK